jgi:tetratricopeptide (TPR) repeat protein
MMKRPWLAPLGSILFGLLLLVAVEGALRLIWTPPFLPAEQMAAVAIDPFEVNNGKAQTKEAYLGAMRPSSFAVPKPAGTFRIFCLGGSTTLGYPYPAEYSWPSSLERRLDRLFPERKVEVINVGGTSYGSARTLAVLRGILDYQPDLVIVATGDAEFVEDSFRVAVARPIPSVSWLHGLYLSRALKQVLPEREVSVSMVDAEDRSAAGFLFAPAVAGTVYLVDKNRRSAVMTSLGKNLAAMTAVASKVDVPLMLMTLPANVASWPPDLDRSLPPVPELRSRWQQHVAVGERLAASGNGQEALGEYASAAKLWNGNATACYDYGQLLLAAGQVDEARFMLLRALDLDPTPVRADSIVNQSIRTAATQAGVPLADSASALAALASHGLIGEEFILDYAHPTPRGHVEIARVVLQALLAKEQKWKIHEARASSVHHAELARLTSAKPEINAELSFVLGQVLERKGLTDKAVDMYRQAIAKGYQGPSPVYSLARLLAMQGHFAEALIMVTSLVEHYPGWEEQYGLLGYLHQQAGEPRAAAKWYRRALDAGDRDPRLFATLAELQSAEGQPLQARQTLEEGVSKHPGNCDLAVMLGRNLERKNDGQGVTAEAFYRKKLSDDPSCQMLWENLGLLLMQQRRWRVAAEVFIDALRQPAPLAQHLLNLGDVYLEGLNDKAAAAEQFERFMVLQPDRVTLVPADFRKELRAGGQP